MIKEIAFIVLVLGCSYAQGQMFGSMASNPLAMMSMMSMLGGGGRAGTGGAGAATGAGGFGGMMMRMMNHPLRLCRETENVRAVPCRHIPKMCDMQSLTQYGMPNMMRCSPVGMGCCLKDITALMISKQLRR